MKPIQDLSDDEFADLLRLAVALPDAPPLLIQNALRAFPAPARMAVPATAAPRAPWRAAANALVSQLKAVLTFDSWGAAPLAMGMRSATTDARHLLYSSQGRDIDLRIGQDAQRFALTGQILGPDETGVVELVDARSSGSVPLHLARLDAMGEFRIPGVDSGCYVVTLRLGSDIIVLPPIDVGSRIR